MASADRERWNAKWAGAEVGRPAQLLLDAAARAELPERGWALDVAGGNGRNALWLAARGLTVTLADVSEVGLERAVAFARERGLPQDALRTLQCDLEVSPPPVEQLRAPSAEGRGGWDLIVCTYYLNRALLPHLPDLLAPGGVLLIAHPTVENLQRHEKPGRAFLLEPGELRRLVLGGAALDEGWELLRDVEGWTADGHHEAHLMARKAKGPAASLSGLQRGPSH